MMKQIQEILKSNGILNKYQNLNQKISGQLLQSRIFLKPRFARLSKGALQRREEGRRQ